MTFVTIVYIHDESFERVEISNGKKKRKIKIRTERKKKTNIKRKKKRKRNLTNRKQFVFIDTYFYY